jgi:hypothetical protein
MLKLLPAFTMCCMLSCWLDPAPMWYCHWCSSPQLKLAQHALLQVATDSAGNVYVVATGAASLQPFTSAGPGPAVASAGAQDVYLARFSPTGALAWITHIGGTGDDDLGFVAVDVSSNPATGGECRLSSYCSGVTLELCPAGAWLPACWVARDACSTPPLLPSCKQGCTKF